ncbi:hypothetical protein PAESOLCIP111_02287 [Paenibacillus solanacearum]|uniref:DUF4395 domain-containing protein n=2 Tax=Paenibacillus solanacearum TaxID=2048548 RepID=A0A916K1H6_9BACL|nr:DUF4395 domain-containing protein [Paenibacillus solanacearum]CAG7620637.1 hypothetical protein PAESOLCIP111_02287 [Paenibacillus solanacearum]
MKEIPIPYVRANQAGMVILILLSIILQQPVILVALWAIQVLGLWQGMRGNLIVQLAAPLLRSRIAGAQTESSELQRFNNAIAVALLTISILCFWVNPDGWIGYVFAGMVALAAFVAICGYCVGCFLYYQFKRLRRR